MGIHKFGAWVEYVSKRSDKIKIANEKVPDNVGCLFMDMNGIFHNAAQLVYVYGGGVPNTEDFKKQFRSRDKEEYTTILKKQLYRQKTFNSKTDEELEYELFEEIINKIMEIIETIDPQDTVVLAVDGVAPMAKITQQRKRRYEAAKASSSKSRFNSSCISPGTEFMLKLDVVIQNFIAQCVKTGRFRFKNIVYSGHLTPGEGEHKIFHMIRKKHFEIDPYKPNVVYGKDADLFMLSLLSEAPLLYLCREDYKMTYNIEGLRFYLNGQMTIRGSFEPDTAQVCRDFVLLMFMIGNDFVPDTIYFHDVKRVISDVLTQYTMTEKTLTDENGQILWENLSEFLNGFSKRETIYLKDLVKEMNTFKYDFPILQQSSKMESHRNDLFDRDETVIKIDMEKYKKLWYERALKPMTKLGKELIQFDLSQNRIDDICLEYLKAFQWIFQYYTRGQKAVSSRFIYIYHFNPLISDLNDMIKRCISSVEKGNTSLCLPRYTDVLKSELDPVITPIHQLISIMPPKSWDLIPQPFRGLMPIRFADISPSDFEVIIEAKSERDEWMTTAILNIVDIVRIDRDISDVKIPAKYKEQPNKYITIAFQPKIKGRRKDKLPVYTTVNPLTEEPKTNEEIHQIDYEAKVEPKSAEQVERIIRAKIKSRSIVKAEKITNKTPNFFWVNENLM
jgi:5'-3' exonuclease